LLQACWRLELDLVLGEGAMEMGMLASGRQPPDAATIKWEKKTIRNQAQHLALSDRLAKIASCQCQHATYHSKHT